VDIILEGEFGMLPVEIKYGQAVCARQLRSLCAFVCEQGCRLDLVVCNIERVTHWMIRLLPFHWAAYEI